MIPGQIMSGAFLRPAKAAAEGLFSAVWPRTCFLCGLANPDRAELCTACQEKFQRCLDQPYCPNCGSNVPPFGVSDGQCGQCRSQKMRFDGVLRVGPYSGALRLLLQRFKFGGQEDLVDLFASPLSRRIVRSEVYEDIDALLAVPTCWQHRLLQRFYPAVLLAKQVAKRSRIPYAALLDRTAGGPRQTLLPESDRRRNVRGKFRMARGCNVAGARLCLVDDVMTTGSTVSECSRVLKRAGAARVYVAVVARAGADFAATDP